MDLLKDVASRLLFSEDGIFNACISDMQLGE